MLCVSFKWGDRDRVGGEGGRVAGLSMNVFDFLMLNI